ncbi:hypothetical protein AKJ53_00710 [candidate division MSBL1 archaeon SCGC-AAA382F02]|uniref:Uncharacterized protein n=1 Tax=candidate division MSBL1 archaeon SCGC-AAA382F02 TaxID=1698282 RepID=A0A133VIN1_9EURY|nr:hypothetical protein AKJ53_00710 [candidate division MSBL1 archaeon SCGC-AAA382F02]
MKEKTYGFLESLKEFFSASLDHEHIIRVEAYDKVDEFLLLCFSDALGIPNPYSYYMSELLPYVGEDLLKWERRMASDRREGLSHLTYKLDHHTW